MPERVWRKRNSLTLFLITYIYPATMENNRRFLKKLNIELPNDPAVPFPGIFPQKL